MKPEIFQKIIVQHLFRNADYCQSLLPFLKPDYFVSEDIRKLIADVIEYSVKHKAFPTIAEYREVHTGTNSKLIDCLNDCLLTKNDNDSEDWNLSAIMDSTEKFIRQKRIFDHLIEVKDMISTDSPEPLKVQEKIERMTEANTFSFNQTIGLNLGDDPLAMFDYLHNKSRYHPTLLQSLDPLIGGGSHEKTLNVIMAQPNLGKTLIKSSLAVNALMQNKKVLYITLEMAEFKIAERILANIFGRKLGELYTLKKQEYLDLYQKSSHIINENLVIKEFSPRSISSNHIRNLLKDLKNKKGFVPDIVFVDYLGLLLPNYVNKNGNSYGDVKQASEELRGIAVDFGIPIWTSIQTNRKGINNLDVDLDDMADSIGPGATADLIISATQDEALKADRLIQLNILKNRFGLNKKKIIVNVDYDYMRITDYNLEETANNAVESATHTAMSNVLSVFGAQTNGLQF